MVLGLEHRVLFWMVIGASRLELQYMVGFEGVGMQLMVIDDDGQRGKSLLKVA